MIPIVSYARSSLGATRRNDGCYNRTETKQFASLTATDTEIQHRLPPFCRDAKMTAMASLWLVPFRKASGARPNSCNNGPGFKELTSKHQRGLP
ncbi:hypothetical protein CEXT_46721 [Caerostris extrusa]|uniref:Uncharacterized protein n=1 Tax=Caerostris extrusa TaxID=172846 RepID=A0AAV4MXN8_CAEEX|nr:hypothetical protein CEXT_46721 [Caerostris extrusa]